MPFPNQKFLNWLSKTKLINILFVLVCLSSCNTVVSISALAKYQPPTGQKPPSKHSQSTATRSGCQERTSEIPLTLLAPYTHVGQTSSPHPVLAWYVSRTDSAPTQLSIYEQNKNQRPKLVYKLNLKTTRGIMKVSLPENQPGLKTGKRYIWEVAIVCNPKYPGNKTRAIAEIDVVSKPIEDPSNSYWYDTLKSSLNQGTNGTISSTAVDLLKQLAELEEEFGQQSSLHSKRLTNIALQSKSIAVKEAKIIK